MRSRSARRAGPYLERPEGIDPVGVPGERSGREGLVLAAALLVAVLALVFTLGWVVYHQIVTDAPPPRDQVPSPGPLTEDGEGSGGAGG